MKLSNCEYKMLDTIKIVSYNFIRGDKHEYKIKQRGRKKIEREVLKREIRDQKVSILFCALAITVPIIWGIGVKVMFPPVLDLASLASGLVVFLLLLYMAIKISSEETSFEMQWLPSLAKIKQLKNELKVLESG